MPMSAAAILQNARSAMYPSARFARTRLFELTPNFSARRFVEFRLFSEGATGRIYLAAWRKPYCRLIANSPGLGPTFPPTERDADTPEESASSCNPSPQHPYAIHTDGRAM